VEITAIGGELWGGIIHLDIIWMSITHCVAVCCGGVE